MAAYAKYHYGSDIAKRDPELLSKFCKRRVSLFTTLSHHKRKGNITDEDYEKLRHYAHIATLEEIELFPLDAFRKGFLAIEDFGEYVTPKPGFPPDIKRNKGSDIDKYHLALMEIVSQHRLLMVKDDRLAQDFNFCIKYLEKRQRQYRDDFSKGKNICDSDPSSPDASPDASLESPDEIDDVINPKTKTEQKKPEHKRVYKLKRKSS